MSMDRCADCDRLIDTDDFPDAYVDIGNMRSQTQTICLCSACQDRRYERDEKWNERSDEALQDKIDKFKAEHPEEDGNEQV